MIKLLLETASITIIVAQITRRVLAQMYDLIVF